MYPLKQGLKRVCDDHGAWCEGWSLPMYPLKQGLKQI